MTFRFAIERQLEKWMAVFTAFCILSFVLITPSVQADSPLCESKFDVMLVVDQSGSMAGQKIVDAIDAAQQFVDLLNSAFHKVGLVTYANSSSMNVNLTNNYFSVKSALAMIQTGGHTNMSDGISTAHYSSSWRGRAVPSALILLSDGVPTGEDSGTKVRQAANAAKNAGITIFTIGLGKDADHDLLREIASSPNLYYYPPNSRDLTAIYQTIAAQLCCGNALLEPDLGEQCDDGNRIDDDGCSASCMFDYRDIGLRIADEYQSIPIAVEKDEVESPLKISKNSVIYNIALVDPSHPDATNIRIQTKDGIKALRRINIPVGTASYMMLWN